MQPPRTVLETLRLAPRWAHAGALIAAVWGAIALYWNGSPILATVLMTVGALAFFFVTLQPAEQPPQALADQADADADLR